VGGCPGGGGGGGGGGGEGTEKELGREYSISFRKNIPWVCRHRGPCIVDRAFKYLATVCDNVLNDVHVKPYTFCLSTHNSPWSKSLCH
jgi:hypothetical protein